MATTAQARPVRLHDAVSDRQEIQPPSPTLTNPDMILPNEPLYAPELDTVSHRGYNNRSTSSQSHRRNDSHGSIIEVATATAMPMRLSVGPTTVLQASSPLYHIYEHGAPLSDIGEEESDAATERGAARSPIPEMPARATTPLLRHKKRVSNMSSSSGSDTGTVEDFDVSKLASSRVAADIENARDAADHDDVQSRRGSKELEDELTLLNDRAERILERARRRLTHMEDNLTKARSSIVLTSPDRRLSASKSSPNIHEGGLGQSPGGGLYRSISQSGQNKRSKAFPVKPQILHHTRTGSDKVTLSGAKLMSAVPEVRSASAMDFSRPRLFGTPEQSRTINSPSSSRSINSPLRVLSEEVESPSTVLTSPGSSLPLQYRGLGIHAAGERGQEDLSNVAHDKVETPKTLERTSSQTSTRSTKELRDQMAEMKSRIAELKNRAQVDSLRRRSLQSLRTPSPFNDPSLRSSSSSEREQSSRVAQSSAPRGHLTSGYAHARVDSAHDNGVYTAAENPVTPTNRRFLGLDAETPNLSSARTDRNTPNLVSRHANARDERNVDGSSGGALPTDGNVEQQPQQVAGDEEMEVNEEEQIYLNEVLEESLHEPEMPAIPGQFYTPGLEDETELSHEERLDAFDYENMFLHSAMGTYRADEGSDNESEDSVETSRQDVATPTLGANDIESHRRHMKVLDDDEEMSTDEEMEAGIAASPNGHVTRAPLHDLKNDVARSHLQVPRQPWMKLGRTSSEVSNTSTASFMTATEGDDGADEDEINEETPNEILNWGDSTAPTHVKTLSQATSATIIWPQPSSQGHERNQTSISSMGSAHDSSLGAPGSTVSGGSRDIDDTYAHSRQYSNNSRTGSFTRFTSAFALNADNGTDEAEEEVETPQAISQPPMFPLHELGSQRQSVVPVIQHVRQSSGKIVAPQNIPLPMSPEPFSTSHNSSNRSQIRAAHSRNTSMQSNGSTSSTNSNSARLRSHPSNVPQIPPPPPPSQRPPPIPTQVQLHRRAQSHASIPSPSPSPSAAAATYRPANTEVLMESLIKLADPQFSLLKPNGAHVVFEDIDKELVLNLLRAVGGTCNAILHDQRGQREQANANMDVGGMEVKELRHRLDRAVGVLVEGWRANVSDNNTDMLPRGVNGNANGVYNVKNVL